MLLFAGHRSTSSQAIPTGSNHTIIQTRKTSLPNTSNNTLSVVRSPQQTKTNASQVRNAGSVSVRSKSPASGRSPRKLPTPRETQLPAQTSNTRDNCQHASYNGRAKSPAPNSQYRRSESPGPSKIRCPSPIRLSVKNIIESKPQNGNIKRSQSPGPTRSSHLSRPR